MPMRIKSVCVGMGPLPSMVVLTPLDSFDQTTKDTQAPEVKLNLSSEDASTLAKTPNMLPIRIGTFDAAAIALSSEDAHHERPKTHDLLSNVICALGGNLVSISINRVEETTFFATLDIKALDGGLHHIDARPSDAIALALRTQTEILVAEDVLEQAGSPDFEAIERNEKASQLKEFHNFVETLNPEDFTIHKDN